MKKLVFVNEPAANVIYIENTNNDNTSRQTPWISLQMPEQL